MLIIAADSREELLETISALKNEDLEGVFKKAAAKGAGIELNSNDMNYKPEEK